MSTQGKGKGDMDIVTLQHKSGASAEIYLFGGTLTSYKTPDGSEKIFVSPGAVFDGKKAIRGGVPLVFPQFGQPDKAMAQHGFARTSIWTVSSITDTPEQCQLVLCLSDSEDTRSKWPFKFELKYEVQLTAVSLQMRLIARNTDDKPFLFQSLLHTYFAIPDIDDVAVRGLAGRNFVDKVDEGKTKAQEDADVHLPSFTDRVYVGDSTCPGDKDVKICSKVGATSSFVCNGATIGGDATPCDVVVWNPYEEASPGDLPPPAFKNFVCVEPGLVSKAHELTPGKEAVVSQKIMAA
eukprot:TRINITY_DN43355_c0_g1_i1.p1 TRINITY_DN43355_c0_g1~~TRINITY_DN43355_c0_g1_i1.p1  ORF type:complete len:314 (+),score=48.41 TRINITY_DN43355_c0_g1_i1:62-943(+)